MVRWGWLPPALRCPSPLPGVLIQSADAYGARHPSTLPSLLLSTPIAVSGPVTSFLNNCNSIFPLLSHHSPWVSMHIAQATPSCSPDPGRCQPVWVPTWPPASAWHKVPFPPWTSLADKSGGCMLALLPAPLPLSLAPSGSIRSIQVLLGTFTKSSVMCKKPYCQINTTTQSNKALFSHPGFFQVLLTTVTPALLAQQRSQIRFLKEETGSFCLEPSGHTREVAAPGTPQPPSPQSFSWCLHPTGKDPDPGRNPNTTLLLPPPPPVSGSSWGTKKDNSFSWFSNEKHQPMLQKENEGVPLVANKSDQEP